MRKVSANKMVAVIDTETNWHDEVMTIGVALADQGTLQCEDRPMTGMRDQVRKNLKR